jgi:hypothetical protein
MIEKVSSTFRVGPEIFGFVARGFFPAWPRRFELATGEDSYQVSPSIFSISGDAGIPTNTFKSPVRTAVR